MLQPTQNDLPQEKRESLVRLLNDRLADLINLQLQAKQAHWNVKGPQFIALHQLFDSVAELLDEPIDSVAERAVALGGTADGTIAVVAQRTQLPPYPLTITSGRDHVTALSAAVATIGKAVRADIDLADALGDADTADLFTGISRELDKQLWFLEAHLQGER